MNLKLFAALSALALASTADVTSAASSDGSISAEEAAIPSCNQTELVYVAEQMTKNNRKKLCESTLGLSEMVRATDTKALCENPSCKVALEALYVKLPNCKYLDWGIRYTVKRLLLFCAINPDEISTNPADYADIPAPTSNSSGSAKKETVNWTDSSSSGTPSFAPIGAPTPVPTQTAAPQVTPATAAPKSAAVSSVTVVSSAAAIAAVAASLAL